MLTNPLIFFYDPVLRAPTIGTMLMCLAASLVGVLVFLRKQSLVGESLSHAAYPGVILGVIGVGLIWGREEASLWVPILLLSGAFLTSLAGLWSIHLLEHHYKVRPDTALCFVLSAFFGIGITLASDVQYSFTALYKQTQIYFYGQAATMIDIHIWVYGVLSCLIALVIFLFYKELHAMIFDRAYAKSIGIKTQTLDNLTYALIVLAVVIGIRSVGVVLMSAMLIAPPAAARQYTHRLGVMFMLAGLFGLASGFFGNVLSVEFSRYFQALYPEARLSFATGPMIVLVSSAICIFSLLLAPERGILPRMFRMLFFRYRCICENILKAMWRLGPGAEIPYKELKRYQQLSDFFLKWILGQLKSQGWIVSPRKGYFNLTESGRHRASHIVRLHRLWEVYLVRCVGLGAEKVHPSAEEMEHIITPALEEELTVLLDNPKIDPHNQPIPPKVGP